MDFTQVIKTNKPNISESSLRTYNSLLKTAYKLMFKDTPNPDVEKFKDVELIKKYLEGRPASSQKTILSALQQVAPMKEFQDMMVQLKVGIQKLEDEQILTEKQEERAISRAEIEKVFKEQRQLVSYLLSKDVLSMNDLQNIQNFVILAVVTGLYICPRRSLDWTEMKFRNYDKDNDNYIEGNEFTWHKFKTAKYYEQGQSDIIPDDLLTIIMNWIKLIPSHIDYLFFNSDYGQLTPATLNQRLNKLFDGKVSINEMRHCFATEKFGKLMLAKKQLEQEEQEMSNTLKKMGSSKNQATTYVKLYKQDGSLCSEKFAK
jgi:Ca2+-binding EF-hand superfamily protein